METKVTKENIETVLKKAMRDRKAVVLVDGPKKNAEEMSLMELADILWDAFWGH